MNATVIAVTTPCSELASSAAALAQTLSLPLQQENRLETALQLVLAPCDEAPGYRLELRHTGADAPGPVYVDFVAGSVGHRRRFGGGRKQPLARAVGLKGGALPLVIDATAGLGRDAFVLAALGCTVCMLERSPIIAALLANGLQRAHADPEVAPIAARMRVVCADAREHLRTLMPHERPEVIYLDPMYPQRNKSALVKKEMRILRALLGDDNDAAEILAPALASALQRVVVKRPGAAPPLNEQPSAFDIRSENTRFDVYLAAPG